MFIEIKNLTKVYDNYLAVDKINFQLNKNRTLGLLGPMDVEKLRLLE